MKLVVKNGFPNVKPGSKTKSRPLMAAIDWAAGDGAVYSADDSGAVHRWTPDGDHSGVVYNQEASITSMAWAPPSGAALAAAAARRGGGGKGGDALGLGGGAHGEVLALGSADGSLKMISGRTGRVDKNVGDAHRGALLVLRWSPDGTSLLSGGEDGQVRQWSKAGMLRSTLVTSKAPIYGAAWTLDSSSGASADSGSGGDGKKGERVGGLGVIYTNGTEIVSKSLTPGAKANSWKAHEGLVLTVDVSTGNGKIVSGGEDRRYKVWDSFGRCVWASDTQEYPITFVRWAPTGAHFAVGAYGLVRVCDAAGWSVARQSPPCGSAYGIGWSSDGTALAVAGGAGSVALGALAGRTVEWKTFTAVLVGKECRMIALRDASMDTGSGDAGLDAEDEDGAVMGDRLEFRERVVDLQMGFNHLVVTTASSVTIYSLSAGAWMSGSPVIVDLSSPAAFVSLGPTGFVVVHSSPALPISFYTFDGRVGCTIKPSSLLSSSNVRASGGGDVLPRSASYVSVAGDTAALVLPAAPSSIHVVDSSTGRTLGAPIKTGHEVAEIHLSRAGATSERKVAWIDKNRELWLSPVYPSAPVKLGSMVSSVAWHDSTDMLAAVLDDQFVVWAYPAAAAVDPDLAGAVRVSELVGDMGKNPDLVDFSGLFVSARRKDGAMIARAVSPYPALVFGHVEHGEWDAAVRLARFVSGVAGGKDRATPLWGMLAALAINAGELGTAEVAYAALNEADKVAYLASVKALPNAEQRAAELAVFRRNVEEAERILIAAGFVYRAIKINIRLFRWERALELAVKHKTHVDTVLGYRAQYLRASGRDETNTRFIKYAKGVDVSWDAIRAKIAEEKAREGRQGDHGTSAPALTA